MAVPTFFLDHPIRLRVTLEFHPVESLRSIRTFINSQGIQVITFPSSDHRSFQIAVSITKKKG